MKNSILNLTMLSILILPLAAKASDSVLYPLTSSSTISMLNARVEVQLEPLASDPHFTVLDTSQSFVLRGSPKQYLVSVNYFSRGYRNEVCELALVGNDGIIRSRINVGGEKNDGEEIVASCVAIDGISAKALDSKNLVVFVVNRLRAGQSHWTSGIIVRLNSVTGELYIDKASDAPSDPRDKSDVTLKNLRSRKLLGTDF